MRKMLLSRSMIAVASYAMRGMPGKSLEAMSQMSLTSGCFMVYCHST
jgi:hypothetical protein